MAPIPRRRPGSVLGPSEWITGTAWITPVSAPAPPSALCVSRAYFEPGARTVWNRHPLGQVLYVIPGDGLVQRVGQPVERITVSDTVCIEPNQWHWHGATADTGMAHIAIQEAGQDGHEADRGAPVAEQYPA
ncbi:cupin domain-containing protein [Cryobacterium sp. W22_MBD10_FK3]|uniref:cupin domain-containing protein n=1 Tax=Cryobacterium sp. W22_MBD10_FK3 TaxID=3240273 RepID=UPI003F8E0A2D